MVHERHGKYGSSVSELPIQYHALETQIVLAKKKVTVSHSGQRSKLSVDTNKVAMHKKQVL